jgi:hypothetical protein
VKHHKRRKLLLFFIAGFLSSDLRFRVLHLQVQGMDKIVETLDSIGITLFVMAALKKISCIFRHSFVCLRYEAPVSSHYRFCLVTVLMKVLHKRRGVRFSKRTNCWCAFSCSICNQNGQLIGCIQSSSFQGYDSIQKSWEGIIS